MDLKEIIPERYRVQYDKKTGAFHILDCWDETIKNISDLNAEVPLTSPALKIVTTEEANALLGAMMKLGWLDKVTRNVHNTASVQPGTPVVTQTASPLGEALKSITTIATKDPPSDVTLAKEAISAIKDIVQKHT